MTEATLLALGSAFLHAAWNLLIKTSDERFLAAWGQFLLGGLLFLPVLFVVGPPGIDVVPLLVASSCVHVVYIGALVRAYHHGDFSFRVSARTRGRRAARCDRRGAVPVRRAVDRASGLRSGLW